MIGDAVKGKSEIHVETMKKETATGDTNVVLLWSGMAFISLLLLAGARKTHKKDDTKA